MEVTIASIVERWTGLERPLFKGKLIDGDGCKCAQGDVLSCAGFSDEDLRQMEQSFADKETARVLGISKTHAIWLRVVNDSSGGAPQIVLTNPEQLVGSNAPLLLAFWKYLDTMTPEQWDSVRASVRASVWDSVRASVRDSVRDSVRASVRASVRDSVRASVRASVWASVWDSVRASVRASVRDSVRDSVRASVWASVWDSVRASVRANTSMASGEIIAMDKLEKDGKTPVFLAFYGFDTWDKVRALGETR